MSDLAIKKEVEQFREILNIVFGRLRSSILRLRGAKIGSKTDIGKGCEIKHPWCVKMGSRVELESFVYLKIVSDKAKLDIGDYSFLGRGTHFDIMESLEIGHHRTLIGPGCFITDHDHSFIVGARIDQQPCKSRSVFIGDDVWLGAKAVVLPGVRIGNGAVVGAGGVVDKDVDAMTVVAGIPAKGIGIRR